MKQPRQLVIEQSIALVAIFAVLVISWLRLAFGWFANDGWYFPAVFGCQLIFIVVQVRVWLWARRNRTQR